MFFALQPPGPRSYNPFRFSDDVTRKWVHARYVAEPHIIAERYAQWEITGALEIRSGTPVVMFGPRTSLALRSKAHLPPVEDPPPDHGPTPDPPPVEQPPPIEDQLKQFLALLIIRRYVTSSSRWQPLCHRAKHFAPIKRANRATVHLRVSTALETQQGAGLTGFLPNDPDCGSAGRHGARI